MHKDKEKIQSWSDIPFDPRLCHLHLDQGVLELFFNVFDVLGLTNECAILELFDLKSKEEGQLAHHRHLESLFHNSTKLPAPRLVSRTKYNVIDIYLAHKNIFINLASKESRIGFAYFKTFP
jgi:hypothetical protein